MTRRWLPLLTLVVAACGRSPQPSAPAVVELESPSAAAPASAAASAAASAPAPSDTPSATPDAGPTLDEATCKARATPADASCKWTVAGVGRCGGAALGHEPSATPTCVCNGCETDSDCTARPHGKCDTFFKVCATSAKACVYPGDPCADGGLLCSKRRYTRPGNRTSEPMACTHDGHGRAVCGPRQSPPP